MSHFQENYEPQWVIENMLLKKGLNILIGAPKARKSTLRRYLVASALAGKEVFGFPVQKINKAYSIVGESVIAAEADLQKKPCQALMPNEKWQERLLLEKPAIGWSLSNEDDLRDLINFIETEKISLVTIDPLVRFHTEEENDATGMSKVFSNLLTLADHATVLVVHHTAKPSDSDENKSIGQMGRGSSVAAGAADVSMLLTKRGDSSKNTLHYECRHAPDPAPTDLYCDPVTGLWMEAACAPSIEDKIRKELSLDPNISGNALIKKLRCRRNDVYEALKRLKGVPESSINPVSTSFQNSINSLDSELTQ